MSLLLRQKAWSVPPGIPIEAPCLAPDRLAGLGPREVAARSVLVGNRAEPLGDLFEVLGEAGEDLVVEGDLSRVALVGAGMTGGRLTVHGRVGPRAGSAMGGGVLTIGGDAGPRAGEGMSGGALVIEGSAGDHLAAPLPGRRGCDRGTIIVRGDAGAMAAFRMRRGTIVVEGDVGPGAGTGMIAGSLFILGRTGPGAGALMRRGTIVAFRRFEPPATFLSAGSVRCPFLRLYADALAAAGVRLPSGAASASYARYTGDSSGRGQGEILIMEMHA